MKVFLIGRSRNGTLRKHNFAMLDRLYSHWQVFSEASAQSTAQMFPFSASPTENMCLGNILYFLIQNSLQTRKVKWLRQKTFYLSQSVQAAQTSLNSIKPQLNPVHCPFLFFPFTDPDLSGHIPAINDSYGGFSRRICKILNLKSHYSGSLTQSV